MSIPALIDPLVAKILLAQSQRLNPFISGRDRSHFASVLLELRRDLVGLLADLPVRCRSFYVLELRSLGVGIDL